VTGENVRKDETRRKVGKCPACRGYLWADVVITTTTSTPIWYDTADAPQSNSTSKATAASLIHHCDESDGDES
jgi:hypothetical protein